MALCRLAPSLTRAAACSTASRIGRLLTTCVEIRNASSTGTPLAIKMMKVRAKRAVLVPRTSRATNGSRNSARWTRRRKPDRRSANTPVSYTHLPATPAADTAKKP